MSYSRQVNQNITDAVLGSIFFSRALDYSRSAVPNLTEPALNETTGIGSVTRFLYGVNNGAGIRQGPTAAGTDPLTATDWNNNSVNIDAGVASDISRINA